MLAALLKFLGFAAWLDRTLDATPPPRPIDNAPITYRQHERIEAELNTLYSISDPYTGETREALGALSSREAIELHRKLQDFNRELASVLHRPEAK